MAIRALATAPPTRLDSIDWLKELPKQYRNRQYLSDGEGKALTFGELHDAACLVASQLHATLGVNRGDRLAVIAGNSLSLAKLYFGCLYAGVTVVPINPVTTTDEINYILDHAGVKAFAYSSDYAAKIPAEGSTSVKPFGLEAWMERAERTEIRANFVAFNGVTEADDLLIVYTSGTTGQPKGVVHRISDLVQNALVFGATVGLNADSKFINLLSMTYLGGYYNLLLLPYVCGCEVVLAPTFGATSAMTFWDTVARHQVNTLWLVPSIIGLLLKMDRAKKGEAYAREHVKLVLCGTAPLPAAIREQFETRYGVSIHENFALSETLFLTTHSPLYKTERNSVGRPIPEIEISILDPKGNSLEVGKEGEVVVRTPFLFRGYYNSEIKQVDALTGDWFPTGDLGKMLPSGELAITGRKKDLIIRGGINISPASIEEVIHEHPLVVECAVVGRPHPVMGEEIVAVVKLADGVALDEKLKQELVKKCAARLSSIKQPADIFSLPALPHTSTGKIQKAKIRAWLARPGELSKVPFSNRGESPHQRPFAFKPSKVIGDVVEAMSIKYNTIVYEMKRRGEDVTVLSLGEAFFDIPLYPFDDLPYPSLYHYSHPRGIPELREKLAEYFLEQYEVEFDPTSEILVTAGSKIAIYMALLACINPNDEVMIHEPAWVSYSEQVRLCHGVPRMVGMDESIFDLEKYITDRTRVIIINSPNNPRGKVYSLAELSFLNQLAEKHELIVLSDEAYSDFLENAPDFISMGNLDREKKHTIIVNSISKNFGISGWRLGYLIANSQIIDQILKINQHLVTCPPTILSYYIARHFDEIIDVTKPQIKALISKRSEIAKYMDEIGLTYLPGEATFYFFVSLGSSALNSEKFCERLLLENHVCAVPGVGYGGSCDKHIRVSVGAEPLDRIFAGLQAIKGLIDITTPTAEAEILEGARLLLFDLGGAKRNEKVCVVTDSTTKAVGDILRKVAEKAGQPVQVFTIEPLKIHGEEPPEEVAEAMRESDLVLGITQRSMAHTKARANACANKTRYLSLPEYSLEMLRHPTLRIDYRKAAAQAKTFADRLTQGSEVRIVSASGTDIHLRIKGRVGNFCPGYVSSENRLGSPPDIECNVSPEETESNGIVIVDGSIPYAGFGKLSQPLKLHVQGGKVRKIEGPAENVAALEKLFTKYGEKSRVLAEFGIGFNPASKLCGNMLIDEGALGTFHFGFGSNSTVGGKNEVPFHLDFIFFASEFYLDGTLYKV